MQYGTTVGFCVPVRVPLILRWNLAERGEWAWPLWIETMIIPHTEIQDDWLTFSPKKIPLKSFPLLTMTLRGGGWWLSRDIDFHWKSVTLIIAHRTLLLPCYELFPSPRRADGKPCKGLAHKVSWSCGKLLSINLFPRKERNKESEDRYWKLISGSCITFTCQTRACWRNIRNQHFLACPSKCHTVITSSLSSLKISCLFSLVLLTFSALSVTHADEAALISRR